MDESTKFSECPMCDCDEIEYMGRLGKLDWFKCRCCGTIYTVDGDDVIIEDMTNVTQKV